MFNPKRLINFAIQPQKYIWLKATLIKETSKAILIEFDGREIWLPKAWILYIKRNQHDPRVSIKISQYHWGKRL